MHPGIKIWPLPQRIRGHPDGHTITHPHMSVLKIEMCGFSLGKNTEKAQKYF